MSNLIKADLKRIFKGKALYLAFLIVIFIVGTSVYLKSPGHIGISSTDANMKASGEIKQYEEEIKNPQDVRKAEGENPKALDLQVLSASGNLYYVLVIVVFAVICVDFSNHTVKNVISTNLSRGKYYLSKLLLSLGLGTMFLLLHNYGFYFSNLLFNGASYTSPLGEITFVFLRQLPVFYGMISVLVMIAVLCKKSSLYNGITIPLVMVFQLLVYLFSSLFHFDAVSMLSFEFEGLLRSLSSSFSISSEILLRGIGMGSLILVLSLGIGITYFKKCDIK